MPENAVSDLEQRCLSQIQQLSDQQVDSCICWNKSTRQPLYDTVRYNMALDTTQFKDG